MKRHITRRQAIRGTGAVVAGVVVAGCSGGGGGDGGDGDGDGGGDGGDGGGGETTVDMTDELVYDPEQVTVSVGDTVVWENVGQIGHSVTAYEEEIPEDAAYFASGGFDSEQEARNNYAPGDSDAGDIGADETYEHTFEVAGTYEYFCIPHESAEMVGTVEVEE